MNFSLENGERRKYIKGFLWTIQDDIIVMKYANKEIDVETAAKLLCKSTHAVRGRLCRIKYKKIFKLQ
jgi:hypothetical protein